MPAVSQIGKRPILFIVGDRDPVAPPEDSHRMYDAAQSPVKAILVVAGAGGLTPPLQQTLISTKPESSISLTLPFRTVLPSEVLRHTDVAILNTEITSALRTQTWQR